MLLRTKELLDAAEIGKLRPRWDGPLTATACPSPIAYTLASQRKMRCSPTVNVDRPSPFSSARTSHPLPARSLTRGRPPAGEHEVDLLFNRWVVRGVTEYLVP